MIERAREALAAADLVRAEAVLRQAKSLGDSADLDALNGRLLEAKLKAAGALGSARGHAGGRGEFVGPPQADAAQVPVSGFGAQCGGLGRNQLYGHAQRKVVDVKALRADPVGVFEAAATDAVLRMSYKPVLKDGTPIAVTTKIRVAFRLAAK